MWVHVIGSLVAPLKMLQVPNAEDKNGIFVVPGVPRIDIWVFPSRGAYKGITNSPTDLINKGPAGGRVIAPDITRFWPINI